jgi:hypothetical protein
LRASSKYGPGSLKGIPMLIAGGMLIISHL